jgi:VanZ family protein
LTAPLHPPGIVRLQHPALRWLCAVIWLAVVTLTLLQSSEHPLVGPPQPRGPVSLQREIFLTSAHIVAFSGMLFLIWWGLQPARRALLVALGFCWLYGIATELLQTLVIDRGASFSDLFFDFAASSMMAFLIFRYQKRQETPSS